MPIVNEKIRVGARISYEKDAQELTPADVTFSGTNPDGDPISPVPAVSVTPGSLKSRVQEAYAILPVPQAGLWTAQLELASGKIFPYRYFVTWTPVAEELRAISRLNVSEDALPDSNIDSALAALALARFAPYPDNPYRSLTGDDRTYADEALMNLAAAGLWGTVQQIKANEQRLKRLTEGDETREYFGPKDISKDVDPPPAWERLAESAWGQLSFVKASRDTLAAKTPVLNTTVKRADRRQSCYRGYC